MTYIPDIPTWPTFMIYIPDLPTWPTYLTYLPDLLPSFKRHFLQFRHLIGQFRNSCDVLLLTKCYQSFLTQKPNYLQPVRLNLRRYRGIQQIIKSYWWTRICKFSRQKCRIYKFCDKNAVFTSFRDKNYVFEQHDQNTVFGFNFVC